MKLYYKNDTFVLVESKDIMKLYKDADLPAPDGKGLHTKEFHVLAIAVALGYVKKGIEKEEAMERGYATAMKQLGKEKAFKK